MKHLPAELIGPSNKYLRSQSGAALLTVVILLLGLSLMLISSTSTSILEQKMASNTHRLLRTFHSADSGVSAVMASNKNNAVAPPLNPIANITTRFRHQGLCEGASLSAVSFQHYEVNSSSHLERGIKSRILAGYCRTVVKQPL